MKKLKKIGKILLIGFICFMALGYFASKSDKNSMADSTEQITETPQQTESESTTPNREQVASASSQSSTEPTQATQESASTESGKQDSDIVPLVGEYTFNDDVMTWNITVNDDGTCVVKSKRGTYYGSWKLWHKAWYNFTMADEFSVVLNAKDELITWQSAIDVKCEWLYVTISDHNAKNPRKRLKLNKVK